MKILIPLSVILLLSLSGCYYDSQEYLYPTIPGSTASIDTTYSKGVMPILQTSCTSCHSNSQAASEGGGVKLEDYADVKVVALNGKLLSSINWTGSSPMPKNSSKLSDAKITAITKWIAAGALNN
jgi:mono/diheme cytochrome c family protein